MCLEIEINIILLKIVGGLGGRKRWMIAAIGMQWQCPIKGIGNAKFVGICIL